MPRYLINDISRSDQIYSGAAPNDGTGTPIRTGFQYLAQWAADINSMTAELYAAVTYVILPSGDTSGATDSRNFAAFEAIAAAALVNAPGLTSFAGNFCLVLGPGDFYINTSTAFMGQSGPSRKGVGIKWRGLGPYLTRVHYSPSVSGPMCVNKYWLSPTFEDMAFIGTDPNSDFLQSLEQGGLSNIQDYRFRNVLWNGQWQHIHLVCGANNNSEWKWDDCTVDGQVLDWVCIPASQTATFTASNATIALNNAAFGFVVGSTITFGSTVGNIASATTYFIVAASSTGIQISATAGGSVLTPNANGSASATVASDQFLNFYWHNAKFWDVQNGAWINASYGGHFKIVNGDISNHNPSQNTYLFNLLGTSHAQGVCNFEAFGLRVEHKSNFSLLLQSQWPQGNILIESYDGSSQVGNRPSTQQYVLIAPVNTAGASVAFRDCSLPGQHAYSWSSNNYAFQHVIEYTSCNLLQNNGPSTFISQSGTNSGGAPLIRFRGCRNLASSITAGYSEVVESDWNWQLASASSFTTKVVNLVGPNSDGPINGGTLTVRLPLNVLVTRIRFLKSANSNTGAYNYSVQTSEGTPTILFSTGAQANAGAAAYLTDSLSQPFSATTDAQRTLVLTDVQNRAGVFTNFQLLVDYLG